MARSRIIKPGFFNNKLLAECDPYARLLFIGLWTLADRDGRIRYTPLGLHGKLFEYDDEVDVDELLTQLESRGFLVKYQTDSGFYLEIVNFAKHQQIHRDEKSNNYPSPKDMQEPKEKPDKNRAESGVSPDKDRVQPGQNPAPSTSTSTSTSTSSSKNNNISTTTNIDTSTSGEKSNHREIDFVLKAINFMASRSNQFQLDLMNNGDLEKKITDWSRECSGGLPWIIFCIGRVWDRHRSGDDGLNDPFAEVEKPLNYIHSVIFPSRHGKEITIDDGKWRFDDRHPVRWWYRTFFEEDIREKGIRQS